METGGRLVALDITDDVAKVVGSSGVEHGTALVFCKHTTCSVLVARPGPQMLRALRRAIDAIAPSGGYYMHDDLTIRTENLVENEPANGPAHIAHVFMGKASETLPIVDGEIALGGDQRVLLVELDGSRRRRYSVQVVGE